MKISPARKSAFEILCKIEKEKAFASILLPIYEENLNKKDRTLCHKITLGVLQRKFYLDEIIKKFTKKSLKKFDLEVLNSLRIGIYQILFLDKVPNYSAINESVNLVKFAKKKSASGLVNAVLRKVSKGNFELEFSDETEKLSIETSHPKWLIKKWIKQFSFENTRKLAYANNKNPKLTFRLAGNFYRLSGEKQKVILNGFSKDISESKILDGCFFAEKFDENLKSLVAKGLIYFQDFGSQTVSASVAIKDDESFFDVCASPGSKTTFVAGKYVKDKRGNLIVAGDFYRHRIKNLQRNCQNQGVEFVNIVQYDAEKSLPFLEGSFDKVLVDAPCTGTGTIRNNPEIRYFLKEKDFEELSVKQLKILENASKSVKRDGKIIYSTCSLEVEENEEVIAKFLAKNGDFEKLTPNLGKDFVTKNNFVRIYPSNKVDSDGFFIAILERKS